ncbi:MAG: hypothetical protein Q7S33_01280 [Nanoarchaeota archaeon]|nr:hypothetical protein [Nanoarchaeota archaeon]
MKPKKEKKYIIRNCPKCKSKNVGVVIGSNGKAWECRDCKFKGSSFTEKEVSEDEFLSSFEDVDEDDRLTEIFINKEVPSSAKPEN